MRLQICDKQGSETNQNENEEERNVWLEDIRPREQRSMQ